MKLKDCENLITASLNLKFIGSYKKSVCKEKAIGTLFKDNQMRHPS